jgi:alginate O-acetyltransferase complex protein AlgJ
MKHRLGISGIFMIIFLVMSGILSFAAIWQARAESPTLESLPIITGKWTPSYEQVFNKKLYSYEYSKDSWGAFNYAAFREGNKGVLVGEDGWLFTSEEFERQPAQDESLRKNSEYIKAVHDYLLAQNVMLVIVPIPAKSRMYREKLGRYQFPAYKENIYQSLLQDMNARHIEVVDTLSTMKASKSGHDMFLKTDTHWTPEGARAIAQVTAEYIKKNIDIPLEQVSYRSEAQEQETHQGDLLRYIPTGSLAHCLQLPEDQLNAYQTQEINVAETGEVNMQDALFSDSSPVTTLVGTSYSANPKWNFVGFLKESLGADVLNAADEGLGPFETMEKYLANDAFRETPPKLVIWEIPERYLSFKYDLDTEFMNKAPNEA